MQRRQFLASMSSAALFGSLACNESAWSQAVPSTLPRTLINVMLVGGADFRHLFVPSPDFNPDYVNRFWAARRSIYTQNYSDYAAMFAAEYRLVNDPLSGASFGIHQSSGWLIERFLAGDAVIISTSGNVD